MSQFWTKWKFQFAQYMNIRKARKEIKQLQMLLEDAYQMMYAADERVKSRTEDVARLGSEVTMLKAKLAAVSTLDPNARCLACGHKQGTIKVIKSVNREVHVEHTCGVCGYQWQETTVREDADEYASWNAK